MQSETDNNQKFRGTDADIAEVDSHTSKMIVIMQNNGWFLCGSRLWHPRFSSDMPYCHITEFRRRFVAQNGQNHIDCIAVRLERNSNYYLLSEAHAHRAEVQTAFNKAYAQDRQLGIQWDLPFNRVSPSPEQEVDAVCGTSVSALIVGQPI